MPFHSQLTPQPYRQGRDTPNHRHPRIMPTMLYTRRPVGSIQPVLLLPGQWRLGVAHGMRQARWQWRQMQRLSHPASPPVRLTQPAARLDRYRQTYCFRYHYAKLPISPDHPQAWPGAPRFPSAAFRMLGAAPPDQQQRVWHFRAGLRRQPAP